MFLDTLDMLLKEKGIRKSTLARESGIPYTTIDGLYKKGCDNIKLSTLQKLADYFDVSVDFLLGKTEVRKISVAEDSDLKVALFGGEGEVTDEMWDEVKKFAEYVKSRYGKN